MSVVIVFDNRPDAGDSIVGPFDSRAIADDAAVRIVEAAPKWARNMEWSWSVAPLAAPPSQLDLVRTCVACGQRNDPERMRVWRDADGSGIWIHRGCEWLRSGGNPPMHDIANREGQQ